MLITVANPIYANTNPNLTNPISPNTQHFQPHTCTAHFSCCHGYWTTCGYVISWTANTWSGQVADWTAHGLVNSQDGQLTDAAANSSCSKLL